MSLLGARVQEIADLPAMSWAEVLSRLLSVLLLIAINAFFVTAEFSMVTVRRSRINQLVEAGDVPAITVQSLIHSIERLLSTMQLGITLSSLALGWIGEDTIAVLIRMSIGYLPLPIYLKSAIAHSASISIVTFFLLAYLQIVLGEILPKSVALVYSEQLARSLGPPSLLISRLFNPFVSFLNQSTRSLLQLAGIEYERTHQPVTPQELQLIIATSSESSGLEAEERELLNNVFEFGEVCVEEVMVPRPSIVALPKTATFQNLLDEMAISNHSRYPVTGDSLDDIIGIIGFKQLAKPLAEGLLSPDTPIVTWISAVRFVPEMMLLGELLPLMQGSSEEIAIVVDEFGGISGLVTLRDLIAEIIGRTYESPDNKEIALQVLDDRTFLAQAQLNVDDVNQILNLDLQVTDEYQTLGGFLSYQLQRMPAVGEVWRCENAELTVVSACGPRLDQIQIQLLDGAARDRVLGEVAAAGGEVGGKGRSNSGLKGAAKFSS
ncbi:MAG: HlyC/CorC family transporter [Microcoleus sp. PH2017_10_PVI_O_A]|nr:HlyC/CorC family transporter [Microcoleus sp. PH2017_10_PVI_O_A]MCC3461469.1 HlyC/CorC family transporter [Microcoleus sp. PH2017_11_PCY_U_A]MCC3479943.1 HlyC/CorC family transporter [Microcoleus sp. PH2017_12_PCY_D_A]MCC3528599.1 HlyC/CorC family transporter [Microcoleus sp. PH2017_21_RUC_O_A]MCC3540918.1 HlyC/CorC family transporter [Microcoleus sp. PH2017_22_RUC_O_B]MCC3560559.1 HlyC/CorC family transporter [Microcoleus sp. PH2017_27_LUM_O_A]